MRVLCVLLPLSRSPCSAVPFRGPLVFSGPFLPSPRVFDGFRLHCVSRLMVMVRHWLWFYRDVFFCFVFFYQALLLSPFYPFYSPVMDLACHESCLGGRGAHTGLDGWWNAKKRKPITDLRTDHQPDHENVCVCVAFFLFFHPKNKTKTYIRKFSCFGSFYVIHRASTLRGEVCQPGSGIIWSDAFARASRLCKRAKRIIRAFTPSGLEGFLCDSAPSAMIFFQGTIVFIVILRGEAKTKQVEFLK